MTEQDQINPELAVRHKDMTDWNSPPTVQDLKNDFTESDATRTSQETKVREWLDNLHVTGKAKPKSRKGRSEAQPKLIRKQAEWRYAALSEPFLSSPDMFKVAPVTWEDKKSAIQNGLVLNNQFNTKIGKQAFIDEYVRTNVDEGTAIVKVSWEFEEEEYQAEEPMMEFYENPEMAPIHEQLNVLMEQNPAEYYADVPFELQEAHRVTMEEGVPVEARVIGTQIVTKTRTLKNQPDLEVCDYREVTIDPSCKGDMKKCRFVVHTFQTSLDELKRDGRYKNLDLVGNSSTDILNAPDDTVESTSTFEFKDKARKQFTVHEYWGFWDIDGTGLVKPIVATWVDNVFIRLEDNPYPHKRIPFVITQYLPVRKSVYGEPDGHLLEDNQKISGAVTRGMIDIMARSANGQTGMRKDMLDATNKRKFERGQDYEFNANVDPRQGVHMHTYAEIPQSAQYMLNLQGMEAESMTGVKAYSAGLSGQALGETATGVRGVLDAASKREAGILRRLATGITEIGRMILSMNAEFLDEREVIRITNEKFVEVKRDDLAGNFDLRLSISTAEEDNAKAQELSFMLQTMGNNMDFEMRNTVMADIARLRKMPELAEKLENFQPQPDPAEQEIKQLEIEKLKREIAEIESRIPKNHADAQLDMAKAREVSSNADLKDLDFVEQESGVKQERELQKQGAQARANMQLESHKAALNEKSERLKGLTEYLKQKSSAN